jgi:hypothetical protein
VSKRARFGNNDATEGVDEHMAWLRTDGFKIKQREHETSADYTARIKLTSSLYDTHFQSRIWCDVEELAMICPAGRENRFYKGGETGHSYKYLEIKNIDPETWTLPSTLTYVAGQDLPTRATYRIRQKDILVSRFKEPPGKAIIALDYPENTIASSNFILVRPRDEDLAYYMLGFIKSTLCQIQLHRLIKRRAIAAEMYQRDFYCLRIPVPHYEIVAEVSRLVCKRLELEEQTRNRLVEDVDYTEEQTKELNEFINITETEIDKMFIEHILSST